MAMNKSCCKNYSCVFHSRCPCILYNSSLSPFLFLSPFLYLSPYISISLSHFLGTWFSIAGNVIWQNRIQPYVFWQAGCKTVLKYIKEITHDLDVRIYESYISILHKLSTSKNLDLLCWRYNSY